MSNQIQDVIAAINEMTVEIGNDDAICAGAEDFAQAVQIVSAITDDLTDCRYTRILAEPFGDIYDICLYSFNGVPLTPLDSDTQPAYIDRSDVRRLEDGATAAGDILQVIITNAILGAV